MKTFILLTGIPGSGKSYWAREYAKSHPYTFIIASDELRKVLTGQYQNWTREGEMWGLFYKYISEFKDKYPDKDVTVIADATNLKNEFRKKYAGIAGFDKRILIEFKKPINTVLKQNEMRDTSRVVPDDVILRMDKNNEEIDEEVISCYDEYIVIK